MLRQSGAVYHSGVRVCVDIHCVSVGKVKNNQVKAVPSRPTSRNTVTDEHATLLQNHHHTALHISTAHILHWISPGRVVTTTHILHWISPGRVVTTEKTVHSSIAHAWYY